MFVIKDYTRLFFCMLRINIKGLKSYGQDFFRRYYCDDYKKYSQYHRSIYDL